MDPVFFRSHAHFRWRIKEDPEQRNQEDTCWDINIKSWRSRWLPRRLWAATLRVPSFRLPNFFSYYQEPLCVTPARFQQPAAWPSTNTHSGESEHRAMASLTFGASLKWAFKEPKFWHVIPFSLWLCFYALEVVTWLHSKWYTRTVIEGNFYCAKIPRSHPRVSRAQLSVMTI